MPLLLYDDIRPYGEPIKTFGGVASGPEPLKVLHKAIHDTLEPLIGKPITETAIVDIMNHIGVCVVAGNVRRTAEIAFGTSDEFINLKNYELNPHRGAYGWTSNNSILAEIGQDYSNVATITAKNGEPGYFWLENAQKYGRIIDGINYKDKRAKGSNPCGEQTLESYECCNLSESFIHNHDSLEDYLTTLKYQYLYNKTITLIPTHWHETNEVMLRNRRIGLSQSGIAQFIDNNSLDVYKEWCEKGYETIQYYDDLYSGWFKIPKSIKTTSIKPSGTVSLLAGATPGMHFPESNFYIRRINIPKNSQLMNAIIKAGYYFEDSVYDSTNYSVQIPISIEGVRTVNEVSAWEQALLSNFIQKYWSDNQVSCTVTFKPDLSVEEELRYESLKRKAKKDLCLTLDEIHEYKKFVIKKASSEAKDIPRILNFIQYESKGISFLPKTEKGVYEQMPYEEVSEETYQKLIKNLRPLDFSYLGEDSIGEKYCSNDSCEITYVKDKNL